MHSFLTAVVPNLPAGPDTLHIHPDTSIGITEIRSIRSFLSKKPAQSPNNIVVIHQAHLLTREAQQAFLKTLEEPPPDALIYLITSYSDQLLPTILSRVQILDQTTAAPAFDLTSAKNLLAELLAAGVGERLLILDRANFTRESAQEFLDRLEYLLHAQITTSPHPQKIYTLISITRTYLKSNVSVRLAMDNFVINLPVF